jgi:uncharacterized membrane protein YphA (DoxX/SURF4 family)
MATNRKLRQSWSDWRLRTLLDQVDESIVHWLTDHSVSFLRISMGVVFLWFGALKFLPNVSPAQSLVMQTTHVLTMGIIPPKVGLVLVATLECAIGIGFLYGRFMRLTLVLMTFQMVGALSPLVLFPETVFTLGLYAPTLEGQYIIKNVVLIGAALVLGTTVRGDRLVAEPR